MRGCVKREEVTVMERMSRSSSGGIVEMDAIVRGLLAEENLFS